MHRVYHKNVHVTSSLEKATDLANSISSRGITFLAVLLASALECILLRQRPKVSIISFISMENGYIALWIVRAARGSRRTHSANPAKVNDISRGPRIGRTSSFSRTSISADPEYRRSICTLCCSSCERNYKRNYETQTFALSVNF